MWSTRDNNWIDDIRVVRNASLWKSLVCDVYRLQIVNYANFYVPEFSARYYTLRFYQIQCSINDTIAANISIINMWLTRPVQGISPPWTNIVLKKYCWLIVPICCQNRIILKSMSRYYLKYKNWWTFFSLTNFYGSILPHSRKFYEFVSFHYFVLPFPQMLILVSVYFCRYFLWGNL